MAFNTYRKKYEDHKIFRLGDIIKFKESQIFEEIEAQGFKVGALSPMNTENRLNNPSYFIPDPWTNTHSDNSFLSKTFTSVIRQIVNDNSESNSNVETETTNNSNSTKVEVDNNQEEVYEVD